MKAKKNGQAWRKLTASAGTAALIMGLLAGCSGNGGSNDGGNADPEASANGGASPAGQQTEAPKQEPYKMSIMLTSYNPEFMDPEGEIYKRLEERTNTDLTLTWVPSTTYSDKLSATVASGELPSAILVLDQKLPYIVNSVRSGMFWEIGPYLKDYPNLGRMSDIALNAISIDGKVYGLYRERDLARDGLMLRKDWLDNLGLKEPATIDEYYEVLKAFVQNDPDQNGKADTTGLAEQQVAAGWRAMLAWHGGPADWELKDGKASPAHLSPAYMDTMKFYKKLYDEKLINLDFAVVKDGKQLINGATAGSWIANLNDAQGIEESVKKVVPTGAITMVNALEGPADLRSPGGSGSYGLFMIPKTSVKTEEELKAVLNFFDKVSDEDMQNMLINGLEGRQFTLENGQYVKTTDSKMLVEYGMGDSTQLAVLRDKITTYGGPLVHMRNEMWQKNAEIAVSNPFQPFISDTYSERGSELNKIIEDARIKFIMGLIDEAGWNDAVAKWRKDGGDKIIEEYTQAYKAVNP
ncbi:extracellular solute-binding protein [Paenibacillus soyae]|uniref:Extracellular solute-binding protein n=1 Tax=Paenibacillus soyae TaxID=2969249 RepID=A0A9X2SDN6_9BACL|nr:extracellular solute-binding protein [Paenibacillus soyae]MCR2807292.1 extracellular solute-binding protein [Paenibacillus soyae]